jgi:hypothetical protein
MSIAVRTRNAIGWSKFSASATVKIMGRPSAMGVTAAVESDIGLTVTWDPPRDTGFGESASDPAVINAYTLVLSRCQEPQGLDCSEKRFAVAPPDDAGSNVTKLIETQGNLVEGIVYYLRVTARNAVGPSFESQSTPFRVPYRIFPR